MKICKERIFYIDFIKGIAIICVTFMHILDVFYPESIVIHKIFYSFELALFFIAGGMILENNMKNMVPNKINIQDFLKKKFKNLMLPYYIYSLIYIIVEIIILTFIFHKDNIIQSIYIWIKLTLTCDGIGAMWFFPSYFLGLCLVIFFIKQKQKSYKKGLIISIILSGLFSIVIQHYFILDMYNQNVTYFLLRTISKTNIAASLIFIGMSIQENIQHFNVIESIKPQSTFRYSILVLLLGLTFALMNSHCPNIRFGCMYNPLYYYISSICLSTFIIYIGIITPKNNFIEFYGTNSLILYLMQNWIVEISNILIKYSNISNILSILIILISSLLIAFVISKIFNIIKITISKLFL